MRHEEIDRLVTQVDAAIVAAAGRLADLKLRVSSVELSVKIAFTKKAGGKLDLTVVKLGSSVASSDISTITVSFKPKSIITASSVDDHFVDALEIVQRALEELDGRFDFTSAKVKMAFELSVEGKISVLVGGEASHAVTHNACLTLVAVD
jgi:hypothetical protein